MDATSAIILGIIQGIAEWLPISSEGMTSLYMTSMGLELSEAIPLAIFLHTGTLLAAIIYFRKDLIQITKELPKYIKKEPTENRRTITFLIIATITTGIIGLPIILFSLDNLNFKGREATAIIGILLIATGLIQKKAEKKETIDKEITKKDSFLIGILQGFSAMPGLSRSGLTTSGLLLRKYDAKKALKLSFIMSIPAVFAAEIGMNIIEPITFNTNSAYMFLSSFIFGYMTIGILLKTAQKIRFSLFCIILGILSIIPLIVSI